MDAPKQQTRLKVVLLSLPARTQAVLEFFFTSTGRSSFAPATEDSADAAIFDLDTLESRQHWLTFHERTGRPGIALSVQPQAVDGAVWVQKPVTPAALLTAAGELHAGRWVRPAPKVAEAPAVVVLAVPLSAAAAPAATPVDTPVSAPADAADPTAAARAELASAMSALPEAAAAKPAAPPVEATPSLEPVAAKPTAGSVAPAASLAGVPAGAPTAAVPPAAARSTPARPAPVTSPAPVASPPSARRPAAAVTPPAPALLPGSGHKPAGLGGLLRRFFGGSAAAGAATPAASPIPATAARSAPVAAASAIVPAASNVSRVEDSAPTQAVTPTAGAAAAPTPVVAAPIEAVPPAAAPVAAPATAPATEPTPAAPVAVPTEAPVPVAVAQADDAAAGPRSRLLGNASSLAAANDALLCGSAEDVPDHHLAEDPERRYDPEVNLVSVLREAYLVGAKWQVPTQLECSAGRIVVDTTRNLVLCDFDAHRLEDLFKRPLARRPKTRTLNRQEQAQVQGQAPHAQGVRRLDDSLWRAGLLTAAGRLPIDLDLSRPVYLKYWPNLTRLTPIPHAARVAALWSARGASITETAQTLGIPQRHVIAFYNGALALDLVTDDGSHIRRAQRKAGRNRGLLTRLLGWLNR